MPNTAYRCIVAIYIQLITNCSETLLTLHNTVHIQTMLIPRLPRCRKVTMMCTLGRYAVGSRVLGYNVGSRLHPKNAPDIVIPDITGLSAY